MKTSRWRLNDENLGQMNVDGVLLVSGRFEGVSELPGNLINGMEGADLVLALIEKELLEFECKRLQIRQFGDNGDLLIPMWAGAWDEVVELFWLVYNVSWMSWFSLDVVWFSWLDWNCLEGIKPKDCPIFL